MNLKKWIGKVVKVELTDSKYYKGTVEDENEQSFFLIDINGKPVYISKLVIKSMWEIKHEIK